VRPGFVNLTLNESGLSFQLTGLTYAGVSQNLGSLTAMGAFLRVNKQVHDATVTGTRSSISSMGVTVTRTATRLSDNYFRMQYSLANTNSNRVSVDLSVNSPVHFGTSDVKTVTYGANQGLILAHALSSDLTLTFILSNSAAVRPVSGWWSGPSWLVGAADWRWLSGGSISSTSSTIGVNFNWQNVPVTASSTTVLAFLVGHGNPPSSLPTANPTPSLFPTQTPATQPGFQKVDLVSDGVGFQLI
jgi:hypothetical protein